ncbi:hypothetical protein Tco_0082221 [Tanacetum coccineum]
MLSNPSQNQTCNLVSPSSSVYTPTPPQVFEIGKCSDKMYLKHHEKQVEDILNYLDELSLHRIEKLEERRINGNKLKTKLKGIRTQIIRLQKEWLLTNKYYPRTENKKMEDEFYGLTVNGSDLKTYIIRFQELAVLCPNMVPNTEKLMKAFIGELPQSVEGNVTAKKPPT